MNYVDNPFNSPSILSFCPGILGLERGLERAIGTIRTLAYVEIETFIIENLVQAMEQGILAPAPIWANLKTFNAEPFHRKVHGIIGGYPCQPFSVSGDRNGTEDPRHLWPFIQQHISASRPIWCFFENVAGHLTLGYDQVYRDLHDLGYSVETGIFTADEVGAPHKRERLFILALDNSCSIRPESFDEIFARWNGSKYASETELEHSAMSRQQSERINANPTDNQKLVGSTKYGSERENFIGEPEVANTEGNGIGGLSECKPGQERSEQIKGVDITGSSEENMAISGSIRSDTGFSEQVKWQKRESGIIINRSDKWPSRPGEAQHEWEEPRTVKSGMGSSANGYNFREDLLRAIGNSVVEQTAEVAFIDLLKKHYEARTKHIIQ